LRSFDPDDLEEARMERKNVNPWEWSKALGFSQGVSLSGASRVLICSGQTAAGPDGAPPTTDDMQEQVRAALSNLGTVLEGAGMSPADIVKITVYTTDVDATLAAWGALKEMFGTNLPASTLVGVTRLAFPALKVEIEAVAAA
jgi:enamine deaminase RidA (YjgF/YER057c/UK114 family)